MVVVATVSRNPVPVTTRSVTLGMGPGHGKVEGLRQVLSLGQGSSSMASRVVLRVGRGWGGRGLNGNAIDAGVG